MTNFTTTWVLWYPLTAGAGDPDDAWRDVLDGPMTLVLVRMSS